MCFFQSTFSGKRGNRKSKFRQDVLGISHTKRTFSVICRDREDDVTRGGDPRGGRRRPQSAVLRSIKRCSGQHRGATGCLGSRTRACPPRASGAPSPPASGGSGTFPRSCGVLLVICSAVAICCKALPLNAPPDRTGLSGLAEHLGTYSWPLCVAVWPILSGMQLASVRYTSPQST